MLNIKILLFCWKLPSIPPPPGADHVTPVVLALFPERKKMADVVEIEALSFIKQEITRRLILVSSKINHHCVLV